MNSPFSRQEEIFANALKLPTSEQCRAYLDEACAGDSQLRQHIETLLAAYQEAGTFLHTPADSVLEPGRRQTDAGAIVTLSEKVGDRIGRYKLLQKIGEGGCGVVYMAEQEEPVRRRVALKVIKLGMDTKTVVARFEAERQALALMDHPNIAKVLDAGATDTGRPYFVMELVRGVKITDYCDQHKLAPRERLELFVKVCQAIQHAHQKGIIHRDIKPSNILVTVNDGVPVPKVIDFGIAKATEGRLTDQTLFTAFEQFIGTPAYMSPEQAVLTSLDIDTRSDIYSLGVLLYELLTGKTPFDPAELMKAGVDEIRRTIRDEEPPRPSTRLSTLLEADLAATAEKRHEDAPHLINLLRGDLDWIVMKCLEKDRQRRYETANGLASDIQRHLKNEPVIARPPSAAYRFQKMVRRNKLAVAAAAIVAGTLLLGVTVSTWQAVLATRARNEAKASEQRAREAALKERELQQRAEKQTEVTRQNLYASEMVLGLQALEAKNFGFARELLNRHRPQHGEADLRQWEWRYLWAATRSDALLELGSHSNSVKGVAFSPQGNLVASSSADHTVKLWSTETGREIALLPHPAAVRAAAFSSDGNQLATISVDGNLRCWDVAKRTEISCTRLGNTDNLTLTGNGCSFSSRGEKLAVGEADGTVNVWNVASGTRMATLRAEGRLFCVAFSRDGDLLAGGCHLTNLVEVWNLRTGNRVCSFTNHTTPVDAPAFSPNRKTLAVANHDGSVKVWDLATRQPIRTFLGHTSWVPAVDYSPDGSYLASASTDHTAILWNLETGEERTLHGHLNEVFAMAFSPDGRTLATGTKIDGAVALWSALPQVKKESNEVVRTLGNYRVSPSVLSPDGTALLKLYEDNQTLGVWDTSALRETSRFSLKIGYTTCFAISPAGRLLAVAHTPGRVKLLDGRTRHEIAQFSISAAAERLVFSPDGSRLAVQTADHKIQAWDIESRRLLAQIDGHVSSIPPDHSSFAFSPNGMALGMGYHDRSAEIIDLATGRRLAHLRGHKSSVSGVVMLPDGKTAATASYDQSVKLWDLGTQRELATLRGEWLACFALAASPDGQRLASGGGESAIRLWDVRTRQLLAVIRGTPGDDVMDLAFSPDGNTLIAVTLYSVRVWRAPTLAEIDVSNIGVAEINGFRHRWTVVEVNKPKQQTNFRCLPPETERTHDNQTYSCN